MQKRLIPRSYEQLMSCILKMDSYTGHRPPGSLPFSAADWQAYQERKTHYSQCLAEYTVSKAHRIMKGGPSKESTARLRLVISHYFQGFGNAVARGLFSTADWRHYGLPADNKRLPALGREAELSMWAAHIASGEAARVARGGVPMAFPSAAEVAEAYAAFRQATNQQGTKAMEAEDKLRELRKAFAPTVKALVRLWDTLEFYNRHYSAGYCRTLLKRAGALYRTEKKVTYRRRLLLSPGKSIVLDQLPWADDTSLKIWIGKGKANVAFNREETDATPSKVRYLKPGQAVQTTRIYIPGQGNRLRIANPGEEAIRVYFWLYA